MKTQEKVETAEPALAAAQGSAIAAGLWVVCHNASFEPSTWGCVAWCNGSVAHVRYGADAPRWSSPIWETNYLRPVLDEEAARKIVEDYERAIDHDPR